MSWIRDEQQKVQEKASDAIVEHQCCFGYSEHTFCSSKDACEVNYELPKPYPATTNQVYGRLPRYDCDKHELYKF